MWLRFGQPFLQEFFIRHHFERLYSPSLQHVQPWYYYLPVLLAALFPWTPALALLIRHKKRWDERRLFLAATVLFGFVLFSASLNKLPGYILPIVPALLILIAAEFEEQFVSRRHRAFFLACAVLIGVVPLLAPTIAASLSIGRFAWSLPALSRTTAFYIALPVVVVLLARRSYIGPLLVLCVLASGIYLKAALYPALDRNASARELWRSLQSQPRGFCDAGMRREWVYGLSFYAGHAIPVCQPNDRRLHLHSPGHGRPVTTG
jgi:4-amino-4-deoxy-L-arabinose transferase-like glycosyltransferase